MATIDPKRYQLAMILTAVAVVIYLCILAIKYFGNKKATIRYPPWLSPCPDYWASEGNCCRRTEDANGEGNGNTTNTTSDLPGGTYGATVDGKGPKVCLGAMSYADKCKWANDSNIYWQGISDVACVPSSFTQYTG